MEQSAEGATDVRPNTPGRVARRIGVSVAGFSLLGVGGAMLVLPGPGIITIAAGMALLGTEYPWARRRLDNVKARVRSATSKER